MDEITMFAELRPESPPDADLNEMRAGARRRFTAAATPRPRWRRPVLAGGLTAAVAAGAAAAVVLAAAPSAPARHPGTVATAAWTVKLDTDGTITIGFRQFADPARLQQVLRDDGVNAYVVQSGWASRMLGNTLDVYPTCRYPDTNHAPEAVQQAVVSRGPTASRMLKGQGWTIHPSAMPAGSALFLVGGPAKSTGGHIEILSAASPVVLNSDDLPACVPVSPPPVPDKAASAAASAAASPWSQP